MKKLIVATLIAGFAVFAWLSLPSPDEVTTPGTSQRTVIGSGVVQRVDEEKGAVTIAHGPLPAFNMIPMTMSYPVKDRSKLAGVQPTQKVEFRLAHDGKNYLITEIK